MFFILSLISICFISPGPVPNLPQQACNETINAGPDQLLCQPGGTVNLNGFFSGKKMRSLEWTPAIGLSDPLILNPVATVSQTTTYTLTIKEPSGNNLLVNGDFEAGNTGFTSNYWYQSPGLSTSGYSIQSNPLVCNSDFSPCGDHTSGSGNMMIVDGSTNAGKAFYCQTVSVVPNTEYYFEFYVTSVHSLSPAVVQAKFNGTLLGSASATSKTCEWIQFSAVWNSGGATSLTICLDDLNTMGGGNDFAVDDIFLLEVCEYKDEVTITVLDEITTQQNFEICLGESVTVGGQYFDNAGDYEVLLQSFHGCDSTLMVHVDIASASVYVVPPETLNCNLTETTLDGSLSQGSNGINSFTWTTSEGLILSNPNSGSVTIGRGGFYQLLVSTQMGSITCFDSMDLFVPQDTISPLVTIADPPFFSCQNATLQLHAQGPPLPGGYSISWSTPNGSILSGQNSFDPVILDPGTYFVTLANLLNGCSHSDTVIVKLVVPTGLDLELDPPGCKRALGELAFIGSSGGLPPYTFSIKGINGTFSQGEDRLLAPGDWTISVIDALGCTFDTTIIIPERQVMTLTVPKEIRMPYGDSCRIELNINFPPSSVNSILWNPAIWITPTADPLVWYTHAPLALQYQITVKTNDGCETKGLIQVLIENDPVLFMPNVFSPNSEDGVNDRFYPFSKPGTVKRILKMGIYDRTGTRLFYIEDFPPDNATYGWDGSFRNNRLDPAVFVWFIEAELNTGEVILLKGDVSLL